MDHMLETFLKEGQGHGVASKPWVGNLRLPEDQKHVEQLIDQGLIRLVSDDYQEQLQEYFAVNNPALIFSPDFGRAFENYVASLNKEAPLWQHGRWVFFPWSFSLVHVLEDEAFQKVRTARNKNLINKEEQEAFYNSTVGIAGLSVGNSVALAIALQGGARRMKLADFDRLALSNMNRIRTSISSLGMRKVDITARQIYEINPYAELELFPEGLTEENINQFFEGLDVVIDEIDNLALKYLIREQASQRQLPVVMAADNGDNGVVDVERYDLDHELEFFHGRMGPVSYEMLKGLDKLSIGRLIVQYIGIETVTERIHQSMPQIGKTLVSWPQLGGAALLNGSAVAYCVRKILNKQSLESNRALISLDECLTPDFHASNNVAKRTASVEEFKKAFGMV